LPSKKKNPEAAGPRGAKDSSHFRIEDLFEIITTLKKCTATFAAIPFPNVEQP
jgi:hypothetical protein